MSILVPRERIEQTILVIRGHRVMLDSDLAELYGVRTEAFNRSSDKEHGTLSQMTSCLAHQKGV